MFDALFKALAQLPEKPLTTVLVKSVILAIVVFIGTYLALGWSIAALDYVTIEWLDWMLKAVAGLGAVFGTWLLFPIIVTAFIGVFLDDVSAAVEDKHYPGDAPGTPVGLADSLFSAIKMVLVMLVLNIFILLPLFFIPVVGQVAYYGINGYLISREYFEQAAMRHHPRQNIRPLRKAQSGSLILLGVGFVFLMTIPVVNLIIPVVATAAMVHMVKKNKLAATTAA